MSELITGVTPVSSLPSMTTEEYQANATVLVVDGNDGRLKRIARTSLYESIQALVKGDKGDTGATGVPEGSAVASIPTLYVDSITGNVYSKTTPTGNTGWKLISLV